MKIVNRKTFLELPENTLFSMVDMLNFNTFKIKGISIDDDFFAQTITLPIRFDSIEDLYGKIDYSLENGTSIDVDFNRQHKGGYNDEDQNYLFAIWEKKDVEALIERLKECL